MNKITNGMVFEQTTAQKNVCHKYQKISSKINFTEQEPEEKQEKGYSFSVAAGLKFDFKDKTGFSMKILTPQEIAEEHKKSIIESKTPSISIKGGRLNIFA